jgi:dihydroxyacetone kinase DhaKLM complex PTS-EIIA-like component DhaM
MANEQLQNAPTPTMMYPKSAGIYLMSRVQELTANVADLITELVARDAKIAAMEARIAELEGSNVTNIKAAD